MIITIIIIKFVYNNNYYYSIITISYKELRDNNNILIKF